MYNQAIGQTAMLTWTGLDPVLPLMSTPVLACHQSTQFQQTLAFYVLPGHLLLLVVAHAGVNSSFRAHTGHHGQAAATCSV